MGGEARFSATMLQRHCNIFVVDHRRLTRRNGRMMADAHRSGSSPAYRARRPPADPCAATENAENRKTGETAENGEKAENGETLHRARAASAPETRKHETAPASCGRAETVKHVTTRPAAIAIRTACETLKQSQETQPGKALGCFAPTMAQGLLRWRPATDAAPRMAGETLKHRAAPFPGAARRTCERNA